MELHCLKLSSARRKKKGKDEYFERGIDGWIDVYKDGWMECLDGRRDDEIDGWVH